MSELVKLTVLLIPKAQEALSVAAQREELSKTDVVNRALQLYNVVCDEMLTQGTTVIEIGNARCDMKDFLL